MQKFFITAALPYANGLLHMGHLLEFVQADIFNRYNKMVGNVCFYLSGSDCHGTPIMIKSIKENVSANYLFNFYRLAQLSKLRFFNIDLDYFYYTHSYENEFFFRRVFNILKNMDFIYKDDIMQLYDNENNMFLPDRYVKGTCPKCYALDQYGDVCEKCSYKYDAIDLINPLSVLSKSIPVKKQSKHYFFNLSKFTVFLKTWCDIISQKPIFNKLMDWFLIGLKSWDISRDLPYFGFKIPNEYFKFVYVWLDAPLGYVSCFYSFCLNNNFNFSDLFCKSSDYLLYHFIGKDIVYFHALFWPSVLRACELKMPNDIFVHGFLTINGNKMSKSDGASLNLDEFLSLIEVDYLRYYFASKLSDQVLDVNFNVNDFIDKINSELISKFINIGGRCSSIISNFFNCVLSENFLDKHLFYEFLSLFDTISSFYKNRLYYKVVNIVMKHADKLNIFLDREKPWLLLKSPETVVRAHDVCTSVLNLFLILLIYIKPILPTLVSRFEYIFNVSDLDFFKIKTPVLKIKMKPYKHICKKLNLSEFEKFL